MNWAPSGSRSTASFASCERTVPPWCWAASTQVDTSDTKKWTCQWGRIVGSIRPGGRFAGQFFGDRDTWARCADRTHHTRGQVEAMLSGFDIEVFNEEERDDAMADGAPKHWHVFHIVARKR